MNSKVTITFNDDKQLAVEIPTDSVREFIHNLQNGELYYDSEREAGLFSPISQIRYIGVSKIQAPKPITEEVPAEEESE